MSCCRLLLRSSSSRREAAALTSVSRRRHSSATTTTKKIGESYSLQRSNSVLAKSYFERMTHELPVRVDWSNDNRKGRGIFAKEAMGPGDVLFVERAFATLAEPNTAIHCANCRKNI